MAPPVVKKAGGALSKKAGPLPVWAWALVVGGGGLAIWLLLRNRTEQGGPTVSLVSGSASPEQMAYGGGPSTGTPPAQMLDAEVLWTIAGSLAQISEESRDRDLNLGDQIAGVKDHVSSTVAAATLGTGIATPTRPVTRPAPAKQPAPSRYYTYLPGRAPKGRKKEEAPKGARLGFTKGKGYYVIR